MTSMTAGRPSPVAASRLQLWTAPLLILALGVLFLAAPPVDRPDIVSRFIVFRVAAGAGGQRRCRISEVAQYPAEWRVGRRLGVGCHCRGGDPPA